MDVLGDTVDELINDEDSADIDDSNLLDLVTNDDDNDEFQDSNEHEE